MFSSAILRRRRRAFSWILFALTTFIFLCLWNFNSMDGNSYASVHSFRLFGGARDKVLPADFFKLPADDPTLVDIVRDSFIRPPSSLEYNLTKPKLLDYSRGQSPIIDKALQGKKEGYFVECGAYDGENQSVTLYFERQKKWRGLLVEPNKERYSLILKKHRHAHTINACVRTDIENWQRPEKSTEINAFFEGRSRDDPNAVPCFWMTTLLLATGEKTVDLISLDLRGKEMTLLQTIDFTRTNIKTITFEVPMSYEESRVMDTLDYMRPRGYTAIHQFTDLIRNTKDLVLKKNDV